MICVVCQERTSAVPCSGCGEEPRLDARFALEGLLGAGSVGTTWRASGPDGPVAIKELALRRARTAKSRELIDREVRVLRELDHPAVPRLHEVVETGTGRGRTLWLVLDLVPGEPLHRVWPEAAPERVVLDLIARIAEILGDLHALRPPVIHRDLKPANIVQRPDGSVALVDFGSVRDAAVGPAGGSTVVGTFGYTAPEQLQGQATAASDLYALGATAVHLLAGRAPHRLLDRAGHLRWRDAVHVSVGLGALLDDLLEPNPAERADDAYGIAKTARWLMRSRERLGSQPDQVRTVGPGGEASAPRPAGPLVGMLQDAYDGKAPDPRPPSPTVRVARRPQPTVELHNTALEQSAPPRVSQASPGSATRRIQLARFSFGGAVAAMAVLAAVPVAMILFVPLLGRLMATPPAATQAAPVPAPVRYQPFTPAQIQAHTKAVIAAHPGSFLGVAAHCIGGPGRPVGVWVTADPGGSWMSTHGDGAENDCLSQVVAGGLTNGGPGGASGTLYVPLRLDGAQSRLDGWLEARTTDGEVVAVDLFSGGVSSHGAYVRVDQDGHITR